VALSVWEYGNRSIFSDHNLPDGVEEHLAATLIAHLGIDKLIEHGEGLISNANRVEFLKPNWHKLWMFIILNPLTPLTLLERLTPYLTLKLYAIVVI